jgi:uncharacterized membrane protein
MTTDETRMTQPAPRPKRWPKVLLALSLTLNLAVLGAVAGAHLRDTRDVSRFPPAERSTLRDAGVGPFFDALPREMRTRMGERLRERAGGLGPDRTALAEDFRAMLAALRAEPYDPARLAAVLADQQQRLQARVEAGRAVLLEEIAAMTPRERADFADRLERGFRHAMEHLDHPPMQPAAARD